MTNPRGGRNGPVPRRIDVDVESGERVDKMLSVRLGLSRTRVAHLIADGHVRINGDSPLKRQVPKVGDRIEVTLPEPEPSGLEPQDLPVGIVYEDEHIAVVDKPFGMVTHIAPGHESGTLVNALLYRLGRLSRLGGDTRPGIVHRLDRDTSGLLVVARTDEAHRKLTEMIRERHIRRGYLACAWGHVEEGLFSVDRAIGRDPHDRRRFCVRPDGRRAITHFRVLERWNSADLLGVRLETGRTHQIRVHMHSLGHPVVGDELYAAGWERGFGGVGGRWADTFMRRVGRMFLHAARLDFTHPFTGAEMSFSLPLPAPLADAVDWARSTS